MCGSFVGMAKPLKKPKPEKVETKADAWDRFEHAVDAAVKSGPKHRTPPKPLKPKKPAGLKE